MFGPLQRPGQGDEGAGSGHAPREVANRVGGDAAQRRGPFGRLGPAVRLARQIGPEVLEAGGAAGEEVAVGQTFGLEHMGQRQHQRGVGSRAQRDPGAALGGVGPLRADVDAAHAPGGEAVEPAGGLVLGDPAHADL